MNTPISQNPSPALQNSDDDIDLIALLWVILSGWKTILAFTLIGLAVGVTYSRYIQPTYQTDALIQIDQRNQAISALGENASGLITTDSSSVDTERELIKSRMVLEPIVDKLHLDVRLVNPSLSTFDRIKLNKVPTQTSTENEIALETNDGIASVSQFDIPSAYVGVPFELVKTNNTIQVSTTISGDDIRFTGSLGQPFSFNTAEGKITFTINSLPDNHPINISKVSKPAAINALSSSLNISEAGGQTGIIRLSMTGSDQEQISRVLKYVITAYVDQNLARESQKTSTTLQFMENQIPELKQELQKSEQAFNDFREKNKSIDINQESSQFLSLKSSLEVQKNELELKKTELLTFYTNEHPLVIQIDQQIAEINKRHIEIDSAIAELPDLQRQYLQFSEDMQINREIYLSMVKNHQQLKVVQAGEIGDIRVIDLPINTYNIIAPNKTQIWALALLLGTLLGSLLVLLKSLLRNTIKDPERLEAKTGVPVIATIPRSQAVRRLEKNRKMPGDHLLTMVDHNSLCYEGVKSLRTFLMFGMPAVSKLAPTDNAKGKVILITGESPNIGKSFISSNLAETFAQLDKKILLIDGDMRLGELHHTFPTNRDTGLAEYLSSQPQLIDQSEHSSGDKALPMNELSDLSNYIHATSYEHIDLMPRGRQPHNPSSLLAGDRFKQLMSQLVAHYDYIIIDSPPVLAASDALIMAQYADQVLLVTRYNQSIEGQAGYAIKQLQKAQVAVNGIVLNDMTQGMMDKYSYHYSYAYGNS